MDVQSFPFINDYKAIDMDLHTAVQLEDLETVKRIISRGENVNNKNLKGWTPLMLCAFTNKGTDVALCLIENGAKNSDVDSRGRTPFMAAVFNGNFNLAVILYRKDLIDVQDIDGKTALMYSMEFRYTDIWNFIMSKKVNLGGQIFKPCPIQYNSLYELLEELSLTHYWDNFKENKIELEQFLKMNIEDFNRIGIKTAGGKKKLMNAIEDLQFNNPRF